MRLCKSPTFTQAAIARRREIGRIAIEPGKTGSIPVQFDSTGFSGNITRTVDVYSNAKNEPHKVLHLKGTIWKPIEYAATAVISIPADGTNEASTTVKIRQ
jgi:hypothetical protein